MGIGERRVNIKKNAKLRLQGHFGTAILIILLTILISGGINILKEATTSVAKTGSFVPKYPYSNTEKIIEQGIGEFVEAAKAGADFDFEDFARSNYLISDVTPYIIGINAIFLIISILIMAPLTIGENGWYVSLHQGDSRSVGAIFDYFSSFKSIMRTIWLWFSLVLRYFLFTSVIPTASMAVFAIAAGICAANGMAYVGIFWVLIAGGIISFVLSIVMFIFTLRYSASTYCFIINPYDSVKTSIKNSIKYMSGHRWEYIVFNLSFLGWFLLGIISCGIGFLWIMPYFQTAQVGFFDDLRIRWEAENMEKTDFDPNDSGVENFSGFNGL